MHRRRIRRPKKKSEWREARKGNKMSALIETMMSVREKPWHGLGVIVEDAPTSAEALRLAGLDWKVERQQLMLPDGRVIPDQYANVRTSDGSVLGLVTGKYQIVQNDEAFAFTDNLIGGDVRYETAGISDGREEGLGARETAC